MEYKHLGRTGLEVSPLCLGTMNFGPYTAEKDAFRIMDRALDAGINFFDTANVYGQSAGKGATEEIVGRWLTGGEDRRRRIVLATKVYGRMGDGPNEGRLSALHIRRACEDSLRRLQTDHIDLYQMHHVDRHAPWDEIFQAMERLVRDGKITYVGSSNFAGWHIATANQIAARRNFLGLVSEQSLYNLADRTVELEVIPAVEAYGMAFLPWSPLARGVLGGVLKGIDGGRRASDMAAKRIASQGEAIRTYEGFCSDVGRAPGEVALAWLRGNAAVTAPIIGPRTMEHLESALASLALDLTAEQAAALDRIWPGPGGAAPEAYAW